MDPGFRRDDGLWCGHSLSPPDDLPSIPIDSDKPSRQGSRTSMAGDRHGHARESIRFAGSPKEQPPRNLSGTEDRAGHDTLESETAVAAGLHRRGKPGPGPRESSQVP